MKAYVGLHSFCISDNGPETYNDGDDKTLAVLGMYAPFIDNDENLGKINPELTARKKLRTIIIMHNIQGK